MFLHRFYKRPSDPFRNNAYSPTFNTACFIVGLVLSKEDGATVGSPEIFSSHQADSSATGLGLVESNEISENDSNNDTLYDDDVA